MTAVDSGQQLGWGSKPGRGAGAPRARRRQQATRERRRSKRLGSVVTAVALLTQFGCGAVHKPSWNKPWGKGTWIPAAVCAVVGTGAGIGVQEGRRGCNTLPDGSKDCDSRNYWQGALVGAAAGAALCALLGHVFLDPTPEPPPPPPPLPTPTPEPAPPPVVKKRIVLRGVNFDFDSSAIRPSSQPVLDQAVAILDENPDVDALVAGYTDWLGSEQYNQSLSVQRAEAVFRYLVNRGIAPERLSVEGFSESNPVASNETEQGRAQNRRVELRVTP